MWTSSSLTCFRLVNLAGSSGVRFKTSSMPFVQMENISHFLRACQSPPLNLLSHDIFQTVDLYESKDPAQVLQCISAFSRRAHAVQPAKFHSALGEKSKGSMMSPQSTGEYSAASPQYGRPRRSSNLSETDSAASSQPSRPVGGRASPYISSSQNHTSTKAESPIKSSGGVSSWSKRGDEGATTPAWNIHQYGYMGGASQGNQGISFGGRRQITSTAPKVPSLAEKERKRREQEAETERLRLQEEEAEKQRQIQREEEEKRERIAEKQRWEEETRRQREQERRRIEEEQSKREAEQSRRRAEQEAQAKKDKERDVRLTSERNQRQAASDVRLTGQFLSQYQFEKKQQPSAQEHEKAAERSRIQELERQLEEAKAREAQYELERQERIQAEKERERSRSRPGDQRDRRDQSRSKSRTRSVPILSGQEEPDPWLEDERAYLRKEWTANNHPSPSQPTPPIQPQRPLPTPQATQASPQQEPTPTPSPPSTSPFSSRPLPNPATYAQANPTSPQRRSPFARPTSTPSPPPQPATQRPTSTTTKPFKKLPFANPSSLLSREMELDRQRQQEWEEAQKATKSAVERGGMGGDGPAATPGGGAWDVHQYGYLGGDSQNRGGTGIGFGMGRRQLVGPREPPSKGG